MSVSTRKCRELLVAGNFTFYATAVDGVVLVETRSFEDERGSFAETYRRDAFAQAGISAEFVQDNQSFSLNGVVRGMHFQRSHPQAKLVRVGFGAAFDVAVDLRRESPTFGRWTAALLTENNNRQLYVPRGCAHGFMALSTSTLLLYRCDDYFAPGDEAGIRWDDPALGIAWPQADRAIVNERDRLLPTFAEECFGRRDGGGKRPAGFPAGESSE